VARIEQGLSRIIDTDKAERRFRYYCSQLVPAFPAVVFEPGTQAQAVRSSSPIVYLAAVTVARIHGAETQRRLNELLFQVIQHCYLRRNTYSLGLVQAVVIAALWYAPVSSSEREVMDLQQLSHVAISMATCIGPGRSNEPDKITGSRPTLMARRTWLACYHICVK
jgi:hypothetical protein